MLIRLIFSGVQPRGTPPASLCGFVAAPHTDIVRVVREVMARLLKSARSTLIPCSAQRKYEHLRRVQEEEGYRRRRLLRRGAARLTVGRLTLRCSMSSLLASWARMA